MSRLELSVHGEELSRRVTLCKHFWANKISVFVCFLCSNFDFFSFFSFLFISLLTMNVQRSAVAANLQHFSIRYLIVRNSALKNPWTCMSELRNFYSENAFEKGQLFLMYIIDISTVRCSSVLDGFVGVALAILLHWISFDEL